MNITKIIALPSQYSISFLGKDSGVLYILVSINIHIGNDMGSGQYVCGVLECSTATWWNCDNDTINKYSGYPKKNVYDNLSKDNEQKKGNFHLGYIR